MTFIQLNLYVQSPITVPVCMEATVMHNINFWLAGGVELSRFLR